MKRRDFIRDFMLIAAAAGVGDTAKAFGAIAERSAVSPSGFPLFRSSRREGFEPELMIQSPFAHLDPFSVTARQLHRFHIEAINPRGITTWSQDLILRGVGATRVEIPDGLGWGTIVVRADVENLSEKPYDNYGFNSVLKMKTPWGMDAHHGVSWSRSPIVKRSFQTIPAPEPGDGILVAAVNPTKKTLLGGVRVFGREGKVLTEAKLKWNPFSQCTVGVGSLPDAPEGTVLLKGIEPGQSLLFEFHDGELGLLKVASWGFSGQPGRKFFFQSHGGGFMRRKERPEALTIPTLELLTGTTPLHDVLDHHHWSQMDFACLGGHPLDQAQGWNSILSLPNLQESEALVLPLVHGSDGKLAFAPERKLLEDWGRKAPREFRIPARGVLHLDLKKHLAAFGPEVRESGGTLRVGIFHHGLLLERSNLLKLLSRGSGEGKVTIGHGHDTAITDANIGPVVKIREQVDGGWRTDRIAFDMGTRYKTAVLLIGNNGTRAEASAFLQKLGTDGPGSRRELPPIPANGFILVPLEKKIGEESSVLRLLSKTEPLSIASYYSYDQNWSQVHGSARISPERIS